MATLKLRHLILYALTFVLLYYSDIPGGALLALASWFQLALLLWKIDFTLKKQTLIFMYFLILIPLFLVLGSTSTFFLIYFNESQLLKTFLMFLVQVIFITTCLQLSIWNFNLVKTEDNLNTILRLTFKELRTNFKIFLLATPLLILFYFLPILSKVDYKISLFIIATHLYIQRQHLKNLSF